MEAKQAARVFGALSHAVRLDLFRTLSREGSRGLTAGELADCSRLPPSTLSFHLRELTATGLLAARRAGRHVHYALRQETLHALLWFLGEDCLQGRIDLCPQPTARIAARLADPTPVDRQTVLFLCSHNAARSQLAEALLRQRAGDRYEVLSAGMKPKPVHPMTLRVLQEADVPIDGLVSKDLGALLGKHTFHRAIVLCPEAQDDCPRVAPFARHVEFWPFPDPSRPAPSPSQQLQRFRDVRDALQARIGTWLLLLRERAAAGWSDGGSARTGSGR